MKIDPNRTWKMVEQRMAGETDPTRRRNLELVLRHMKAEARADIDGVIATLCARPRYRTHARPDEDYLNPDGSPQAVREFYDLTIVQTGAFRLEFEVDRVIVDDDAVFTEGIMRMAYPGSTLALMEIEVDEPEAFYVAQTRMGIVWPVDSSEGKLVGEETYSGVDAFAGIAERKITLADIVPLEED